MNSRIGKLQSDIAYLEKRQWDLIDRRKYTEANQLSIKCVKLKQELDMVKGEEP